MLPAVCEDCMNNHQEYWLSAMFLGLLTLMVARAAPGQIMSPPINGFNATIALPETIDSFYTGVNKGLEKAGDGLEHLTRSDQDVKIRSGSLDGLLPGTSVVVHYRVKGIQASADDVALTASENVAPNEGTIVGVDRGKGRITVKFSAGGTETFRAAHASEPDDTRVIVYRSGEPSPRTAHFFKPVH